MSARTLLMTAPAAAGGGGDPYATEVLDDSPVGYWKMDDASGDFADSSGGGNTATAAGSVTYQESGLIGGSSFAAEFTTAATRGVFGTLLSGKDTVTFELWFAPSSLAAAGKLIEAGGSAVGLAVEVDTGGTVTVYHDGSGTDISSTTTLTVGTAYHIVAVSELNVGMRLYINGAEDASSLSGSWGAATGANAGAIGWDGNTNTPGPTIAAALGHYDEVAGYTAALSAARIAAHYAARDTA